MRKVTVKLEMRIVMSVDEGIEISRVVSELDYQVNDTTTAKRAKPYSEFCRPDSELLAG